MSSNQHHFDICKPHLCPESLSWWLTLFLFLLPHTAFVIAALEEQQLLAIEGRTKPISSLHSQMLTSLCSTMIMKITAHMLSPYSCTFNIMTIGLLTKVYIIIQKKLKSLSLTKVFFSLYMVLLFNPLCGDWSIIKRSFFWNNTTMLSIQRGLHQHIYMFVVLLKITVEIQ